MTVVNSLIWDDWNREHLTRHHISPEEVEEICHGKHLTVESYRRRILIMGKTKAGKGLSIVLSPENPNLKPYGHGIYYVVTAFEKEVTS